MTLAEIKSLKVLPVNTKTVNKLYDYAKFTEEELKVPTMDEYFEICNSNGCVAFVELKEDKGVIEAMIKAIEKYGMQNRLFEHGRCHGPFARHRHFAAFLQLRRYCIGAAAV